MFRPKRKFDDFSVEVEAHLALEIERLQEEQGLTYEQAKSVAYRAFGNVTKAQERFYEAGRWLWLDHVWQDVRYGLRTLRKSPGFTIVAVLTLALGIGANTAMFSVVDGILLKPLAFPNSGRLVRLYQGNPASGASRILNSRADLEEAQKENDVFEGISPYRRIPATLTGRGVPQIFVGATVSSNFFHVMGTRALLGRAFASEENGAENETGAQTVVLSRALWERRFDASPKAIGETAVLDGKPYTVIGVMPAGFDFPPILAPAAAFFRTAFWIPLEHAHEPRGNRDIEAVARLKPGISLPRAQAAMNTIAARLEQRYPADKGWVFEIVPLRESITQNARLPILLLFAAVGIVLLIACANAANLLLARASTRRKEMAIRAAIGASRIRVIRQLLCESTLVALAGGALGALLALWAAAVLRGIVPPETPRIGNIGVNGFVLGVTLVVSVAAGVALGLGPAIAVSKFSASALQQRNTVFTPGSRLFRSHRALKTAVIFQLALSVPLLVGAGLMLRSYIRLTSLHLGFQPKHLLTFVLQPSGRTYDTPANRKRFYAEVLARTAALPGVLSAGLVDDMPFAGYYGVNFTRENQGQPLGVSPPQADVKHVSAAYFSTMQIRLIAGRSFTAADTKGSAPVAIINEALRRRYFAGENPIGTRVRLSAEQPWREIVGVVGDARDTDLESAPAPELYVPFLQHATDEGWAAFMVRTKGDPRAMEGAVRRAVFAVDTDQPLALVRSMQQILSARTAPTRFRAEVLASFSILALILTAIGLYGTLAYVVAQRNHEISLRIVFGARRDALLRMALGEGLALAGIGLTAGVAGALVSTQLLRSLLFEIYPTDAATFAAVAVFMTLIAAAACWIPARRAMRVDPIVALRHE